MKKAIIFFACLLLAAPAVIAATWSGNSADVNISFDSYPDNSSSRYPQITAGPEGNLYCIWRQGPSSGAGELYFGKSTDNGATWSSYTSDRMISANDGQNVGGSEHAFAITTNSLGHIFIVWAEDLYTLPNDYQEIMLLKSTDYGDTWIHGDTDFNISFSGSTVDAYDPEIAVDNNDNIYVVWNQDIATADSSEIHISISTDNGDTWSGTAADRYISYYNASDANGAAIAITPNNDIFVVWREKIDPTNSDTYTIMYGKSTDGGATFNSETSDNPTSVNVRLSYPPEIVADDSGNVHVIWKGYETLGIPSQLFYTGSTDGGATWSGNSGFRMVDFGPDDGEHVYYPSLEVTSSGKLIAVWDESLPIYNDYAAIFASYSHDGGLTWTGNDEPEVLDFPDNRGAYAPDVVAGDGDTLYVVWNESLQLSGSNYYDILISKGDTLATGGGGGGCDYIVGDVNGSDNYNGLDITYGVNFFKYGSPDPQCDPDCPPCPDWHNYNGLDITYGVNYFKYGSPAPEPCADCPPIE